MNALPAGPRGFPPGKKAGAASCSPECGIFPPQREGPAEPEPRRRSGFRVRGSGWMKPRVSRLPGAKGSEAPRPGCDSSTDKCAHLRVRI